MVESLSTYAYQGTSLHPDCDPEARVFLEGIEIPYVNVSDTETPAIETRIRNEGVADITRFSKVIVPIEWFGQTIDPVQDVLAGNVENAPDVHIQLKDPSGRYGTIHRGFLKAAGPHDGECVALSVGDYSEMFANVRFSGTYGDDAVEANLGRLVKDAIGTAVGNHEGVPPIDLKGTIESTKLSGPVTPGGFEDGGLRGLGKLYNFEKDKSFNANRDTVADAISWACEQIDARWWFDYVDGKEIIIIEELDSYPRFTDVRLFDSVEYSLSEPIQFREFLDKDGRPIIVRNNNAAFQLSPAHTLQGVGSGSWKDKIRGGGDAPIATVRHKRLSELAGANSQPPRREFDSTALDATKFRTVSALRSHIEDAAGGEIVVEPEPSVRPHTTVEAKPVCDSRVFSNLPSITYQVQEVIHRIEANDAVSADQSPSSTVLRCGIATEREEFEFVEPTGTIDR